MSARWVQNILMMEHQNGLMTCRFDTLLNLMNLLFPFCPIILLFHRIWLIYLTYVNRLILTFNSRPHDAWLEMAKPFIRAFKAGSTSVDGYLTEDQLFYWYRPAPKRVNCNATDTCMSPANNGSGLYYIGPPNGWETVQDGIFVVTLLKEAATVQVRSGKYSNDFRVPAGPAAIQVPMGIGRQSFSVSRGSKLVLSGTSLKDVVDQCPCGVYNFNAYGEFFLFHFFSLYHSLLFPSHCPSKRKIYGRKKERN